MKILLVGLLAVVMVGCAPMTTVRVYEDGKLVEVVSLTGKASYYGDEFHGRETASGEIYDKNKLTAAHKTLPFGTRLKVTNLENKKSVIVRVNDRGPFVEGRIIDLSLNAAKKVDMIEQGVVKVRIEVLT